MKAVLFVLMMGNAPVAHFEDAYACNQAAIELLNDERAERVGCEGFDVQGNPVKPVQGRITYLYGHGVAKEDRIILEIK